MRDWIDVNDKLPDFLEWVIVSLKYSDGAINVTTATFNNGKWEIDRELSFNKGKDYTVTHWMRFPKTPWEINARQNGTAIETGQ